MSNIQVNIYALQTGISDEEFCENLQHRLRLGGILTNEPSIDRVTDTLQVVTIGALGTDTGGAITRCIAPYLVDWLKQAGVSCDSFNIAGA